MASPHPTPTPHEQTTQEHPHVQDSDHACHSHPGHDHSAHQLDRNLVLSILLNSGIVVAEFVGGVLSGSLALLSDALHNLSDVAALFIAFFARRLGRRPPSLRHTYGLRRLEVFAALLNSAVLLVVSTIITREALIRLAHPQAVKGTLMFTVALIGLLANLASVFLLKSHAHGDLNIRGAFLHLVQDTLSSVVVVLAALFSDWRYGPWIDPLASLLVILVIIHSGWILLRETFHILMEGTPEGLDLEELKRGIEQHFSVRDVHHLHAWEAGSGQRLLTAHLVFEDQPLAAVEQTLEDVHGYLKDSWSIAHATLEPEIDRCPEKGLLGRHADHL